MCSDSKGIRMHRTALYFYQEAPEKVVVGERLSGTTFMKDFFT